MVITPFTFIKTTAFKERVELADKLNEVIAVLNQYPVTITNITMTTNNGTFTTTFYMSDGSTISYTYTLEDYVTNSALATILNDYATKSYVDGKDEQNVKLTGDQAISGTKISTGDIRVKTTPPNVNSAVNSAYVNDATDGVNNIVHKSGTETVEGTKSFTSLNKGQLNKVPCSHTHDGQAYWVRICRINVGQRLMHEVIEIVDNITTSAMLNICELRIATTQGGTVVTANSRISSTSTSGGVLGTSRIYVGLKSGDYVDVWVQRLTNAYDRISISDIVVYVTGMPNPWQTYVNIDLYEQENAPLSTDYDTLIHPTPFDYINIGN